ncbi:MAG: hypothetical protein GXP27_02685 [Planctomycetes bacterium]|nr:hypothetical protein [Planctomycetota bacterium]
MRTIIFVGPCLLVLVAVSTAAEKSPNLVRNPGFETDAGWGFSGPREHIRFDTNQAHSGRRSLRISHPEPVPASGARQPLELNQRFARPLLISGWSRAENVSGRADNHYSIWCDVRYVKQKRPGRVDVAAMARFETGTHDWQYSEVLLIPERPIKSGAVHALFRHHAGTVWFDDIQVRELPPFAPAARAKTAPPAVALATDDGLSLHFLSDGTLDAVQLDDQRFVAPRGAGLFVGDYRLRRFWPAAGALSTRDNKARLRCELKEAGLQLEAEFQVLQHAVAVSGWVRDTTERDRAIDVCLTLPFGQPGWSWWEDMAIHEKLDGASGFSKKDFPLAAVTGPDAGLAVAVPADAPCQFTMQYTPENRLMARLHFGLTPDARGQLQSRAPFRLLIFRVDSRWGFRDALARYYALNPERFQRRARHDGLWLFAFSPSKLPNPQDYYYWEGGPAGAEEAARLGIGTFPYFIPVQRTVNRLPRLPRNYEDAMQFLKNYRPTYTGWGGRGTREQIENAAFRDADGRYEILIRNHVGADIKPRQPINMVVFSVNPNPNLFSDDESKLTPARDTLARIRQMLKDHPTIAGVYLDSMSGWSGRKLNFRRDHFAYERLPLTYDPQTGRVTVHGQFDGVQFLQALGELLHPTGRLIFQNLNYPHRMVWHHFYGDVSGFEGAYRHLSVSAYDFVRAATFQKPVLLLDYLKVVGRPTGLDTREGMERYWKYAVAYGFLPAVGRYCDRVYREHGDLYRRYMPILRRLSAAGWQPVTGATCSNESIRLERFGPKDGRVYFTVFNAGQDAERIVITFHPRDFGASALGRIASLLDGRTLGRGPTPVTLTLPAEGLAVLSAEIQQR